MNTAPAFAAVTASTVACAAFAQALYTNGPLSTGPNLSSGPAAPTGYEWSEMQAQNSTIGFTAARYADDFTLGAQTLIQSIDVFAYVSGAGTSVSPFTAATLQIWSGKPGVTGSTVVFGNTTTNRLASSTVASIMRTHYQTAETTRVVWTNRITVNTTLPPGDYWLDWGLNSVGTVPPVTIPGSLGKTGANAMTWTVAIGFWRDANDGTSTVAQDFPFGLNGQATGAVCVPNCDGSSAVPFLNVADFTCFLQKYAAGCPSPTPCYPNCDGSTTAPFLNVADFTCFLQKYAAGCSAP